MRESVRGGGGEYVLFSVFFSFFFFHIKIAANIRTHVGVCVPGAQVNARGACFSGTGFFYCRNFSVLHHLRI